MIRRVPVALLIPTLDQIGGAERQVLLLAKGLAARGWPATVIALSGSGGEPALELSEANVNFLSLQMRKAWIDPRGWLRYLRWVRSHRPEIVHAHLPHATWFARCARLVAPVPVVLDTLHTTNTGGLLRQLAYRLTGPLSSQTTAVSQAVADAAVSSGMLKIERLTILPNGVELPPQPLAANPETKSEFVWLAIGRLAPVKDYPTLLRAFATLPETASLLILGSGPDQAALIRLAATLGIAARVRFTGFQRDIQPWLQSADALVLSSLWEGLPMSVLEAQAAGLPVVATRGAGTSEAMIEGQTGFLVPTSDGTALAAAMAQLMAMPCAARSSMAAQGRRFIEQNFSLDPILDRWETLYTSLLSQHSQPSRLG